jgi:hypothetical protein
MVLGEITVVVVCAKGFWWEQVFQRNSGGIWRNPDKLQELQILGKREFSYPCQKEVPVNKFLWKNKNPKES